MRPEAGTPIRSEARATGASKRSMRARRSSQRAGAAVDAVEAAALACFEDDVCFNAGRGSVLTAKAASSLTPRSWKGGTAGRRGGGNPTTRAPVSLARRLMEQGPHVFLSGHAADHFAAAAGLEQVDNGCFISRTATTA